MVKSAVKVCIRTRPTAAFASDAIQVLPDRKSINVHVKKKGESSIVNNAVEDYTFKFDGVMHNASQETVYEECVSDIVKSVLDGFNGTVLCYGQTGAGKTFTMSGGQTEYKYRGMIPRAISHVFQEVQSRPEQAITVRVSFLEVYNETLYDLLAASSPHSSEDLAVMEDARGNTFVKGLSQQIANNEEEALSLMFEGETNRAIAEHQLNKGSTRSHCVFTIHIESRSRVESDGKTVRSKMNLVDLAGSERVGKTGSEGLVLKEAGYINKSLTFLEQVVIALSTPSRDHVPYRQTKLTNVLKDSLGGNCKTLMIANIWPEAHFIDETVSTLKFATRMMRVSNEATINVQLDAQAMIRKLENEVRELKQELTMRDQLSAKSHVTYEPYTEEQRHELSKVVRKYLAGNSESDDIEIVNLRQIKEVMLQFRNIVRSIQTETEASLRAKYTLAEKNGGSGAAGSKAGFGSGSHEDGVGDVDGAAGFGVGVAAPAASPAAPKGVRVGGGLSSPVQSQAAGLASSSSFSSSAAEGGAAPSGSGASGSGGAVDRNIAYEDFKNTTGSETNKSLKENTGVLKDKKRLVKDLSLACNQAKREIDHLRELVERKKSDRAQSGGDDEEGDVIDEEEFAYIKSLKDKKRLYRDAYEQLRTAQQEVEFVTRLVDQARSKLVLDFEEWFERTYGGAAPALGKSSPAVDGDQEQLDDGEKFERMEAERIMQRDPEALAFYNARKKLPGTGNLAATKRR